MNRELSEFYAELKARIQLHKLSIAGSYVAREFINAQQSGDITLPQAIIEEQAQNYSNRVLQEAFADGSFNALYEKAWNELKYIMPDDTRVTR